MSRTVQLQDIDVEEIAYHRNGVGGLPFTVVNFQWAYDGSDGKEPFVGIVFGLDDEQQAEVDAGRYINPPTAVLQRDQLSEGIIAFGENSWRGDTFDKALREAIAQHEASL